MKDARVSAAEVLDRLEKHYGPQKHAGPSKPYEMLLYASCGYPANDLTCGKGYQGLRREVGTEPQRILSASMTKLARATKPGGMFPKLRAERLKSIARMATKEFDGNIEAALQKLLDAGEQDPGIGIKNAKKVLKKFPVIGEPGAEKVLLFAGLAPVTAVPSAFVHALSRIWMGEEYTNYVAGYRAAQGILANELPATFEARQRAYLLLKRHGQEVCKRSKPKCELCPVSGQCSYFQAKQKN